MNKRWMRPILIVGGLAAIGAAGYAFATMRPVAVEVARVETNVPVRVFGLGTVEAQIVARIGFEVPATLTELSADHGDVVKKGAILARLNATQQETRVNRAEAAVLAAEAATRKAEANVGRARTVLVQSREANRRIQALAESSVASRQAAEETQRDEDVAAADLSVATGDFDVAKAQIADAKASLAFERSLLERYSLFAPFDAVVVQRHVELGTVVKAGDDIFTLLAPETTWTLAYIDEARAGVIEEGQPAEVRLRSQPHATYPARVSRIGIESDRVNEERRVWVRCVECPTRVFLGEQAEVIITVAVLDQALLVPEAAVSGFDGHRGTVWTVRDGKLKRTSLIFGHRTEDARLQVTEGLADGEQVVITLPPGLREGRSVVVREGAEP
jgi:HlyD family secretion protein